MQAKQDLIEAMFHMSRLMKEKMTFRSDLMHLSSLQIQTLIFLKQRKNASMSEIAEAFSIELPSATSLINKLVKIDLSVRKTDKADRRLVRISLSTKGQKLLAQAMTIRQKKIKQLLSVLTDTEQKQLLDILKKFTLQLEEDHEK